MLRSLSVISQVPLMKTKSKLGPLTERLYYRGLVAEMCMLDCSHQLVKFSDTMLVVKNCPQ